MPSGPRSLGGIIPVPVALGISDEHRHKLLRIARKLGKPFHLHRAQAPGAHRHLRRRRPARAETFRSCARAPFWSMTSMTSRGRARSIAARPEDVAFIQFSSGSTSEPKGVVLTHANIIANCAWRDRRRRSSTQNDVSLSWMPLTHDMGLIGFHIMMFSNQVHMPPHAHGAVRAPPAAVAVARLANARHASCARPTSATGTT